jgi:hypothetical protein
LRDFLRPPALAGGFFYGGKQMRDEVVDASAATIAAAGNKITIGGVASIFGGWVTNIDLLSVLGVLFAGLGVLISWYFNSKRNKREAEVHELDKQERMARIARLKEWTHDDE